MLKEYNLYFISKFYERWDGRNAAHFQVALEVEYWSIVLDHSFSNSCHFTIRHVAYLSIRKA